MPSLRRDFGNRIRAIRRERKLTQEQFAELVGISVDFLSLIERGINSPSFEVLEQMAVSLRMPLRDVFDFRRKASPPDNDRMPPAIVEPATRASAKTRDNRTKRPTKKLKSQPLP